jgi:hypothetical protein
MRSLVKRLFFVKQAFHRRRLFGVLCKSGLGVVKIVFKKNKLQPRQNIKQHFIIRLNEIFPWP